MRRPREGTRLASLALGGLLLAAFLAMAALFAAATRPLWSAAGLAALGGGDWFYRDGRFGVLALVYGTVAVAVVALGLAAPVGVGAAVFIAEWLPPRLRLAAKSLVELLAAVPSVVYGLVGVLLLRGWMERLLAPFEPLSGDTLATAGVLLAVMVLPTVTTLAEDALTGVPAAQRRAARALGMRRGETVLRVVVPQALPGLVAALLLGLGRALGETVAVFLVVGRLDGQWPQRWLSARPLADAGQTLTSKLAGPEPFLAYGDPRHWGALMALALLLLALTATVTALGRALAGRGSEHV